MREWTRAEERGEEGWEEVTQLLMLGEWRKNNNNNNKNKGKGKGKGRSNDYT